VGVAVGVRVKVRVGVSVNVGVGVTVAVDVAVGVDVGVGVAVLVGVGVNVGPNNCPGWQADNNTAMIAARNNKYVQSCLNLFIYHSLQCIFVCNVGTVHAYL
jgi:hypothetical protein